MSESQNLEQVFSDLFKGGATATGEEELLRLASKYSMQLSTAKIKALLYIYWYSDTCGVPKLKIALDRFIENWLRLMEYNNSAGYIMKIMEFISLRRFLNEQSFKVDIKK